MPAQTPVRVSRTSFFVRASFDRARRSAFQATKTQQPHLTGLLFTAINRHIQPTSAFPHKGTNFYSETPPDDDWTSCMGIASWTDLHMPYFKHGSVCREGDQAKRLRARARQHALAPSAWRSHGPTDTCGEAGRCRRDRNFPHSPLSPGFM